jgi:hypothetical protein
VSGISAFFLHGLLLLGELGLLSMPNISSNCYYPKGWRLLEFFLSTCSYTHFISDCFPVKSTGKIQHLISGPDDDHPWSLNGEG